MLTAGFNHPRAVVGLLAAALLATGGCGPSRPRVTGRVTLDQQPLAGATVLFMPEAAEEAPAQGVTADDGTYTLEQEAATEGVLPGRYVVRISTYQPSQPHADPPQPRIAERVPVQYNLESELSAEVTPEQHEFDFALDSRGRIFQPPEERF